MNQESAYIPRKKRRVSKNPFKSLGLTVMVKILFYTSPSQRQQLRQVCFKWKSIIDEEFGFQVRNWKCFHFHQENLMVLQVNGFDHTPFPLILPTLCHNNLRALIIRINPTPPTHIKTEEESLTDISLHTTFSPSYQEILDYLLSTRVLLLPRLERCKIKCSDCHSKSTHDWQHMRIVYLFFALLQNSPVEHLDFFADGTDWELPLEQIFQMAIPRLNIYAQDIGPQFPYDRINLSPNVKFVPVQLLQSSLRSINFRNDYQVDLQFLWDVPRSSHKDIVPFPQCPKRAFLLDKVIFRIGSGKKWLSNGWTTILQNQWLIRELNYELHFQNEMRLQVKYILRNNQQSLRTLILFGTDDSMYGMDSFDGGLFRDLFNLENLELIGESKEDKIYFKNLQPMLIHPWSLPQSLKTLVVHGPIDCGKVGLGVALQHLTRLRTLEMLGRYRSPWFYSLDWIPIFQIDSAFIESFLDFLPSLVKWELIYLMSPQQSRNRQNEQAFVRRDEDYKSRHFTMCTNPVHCTRRDILSTKIRKEY